MMLQTCKPTSTGQNVIVSLRPIFVIFARQFNCCTNLVLLAHATLKKNAFVISGMSGVCVGTMLSDLSLAFAYLSNFVGYA